MKNANEYLHLLAKLTKAEPEPLTQEPLPVAEKKESETERKNDEMVEEQKALEADMMRDLDIGGTQGDTEKIMDRLLKSVNMVKGVLQSNLKLRQQIVQMNKQLSQTNIDHCHVESENEELKEKIGILEVMGLGSGESGVVQDKADLASELHQLKKKKQMLERHLRELERESINIRITKNEEARVDVAGTDDLEPVRSAIGGNSIPELERRPYAKHRKPFICKCSQEGMVKTTYPAQKMSSNFSLYVKVHSRRHCALPRECLHCA